MKSPKYLLKAESKFTRFEFISEGNKGAIQKLIEFQATSESEFYNLAFGDKDPLTGDINDLAVTNNGDTEKVLVTVVAALYVFFENYLTAFVYATGSTKTRTRLYRMGINKFTKNCKLIFIYTVRLGMIIRYLN